jgi:exonuclease III
VVPAAITRAIRKTGDGYTIHGHAAESANGACSTSGVAVIIHSSWEVTKVSRHGSGRAIAVVVKRGSFEMVVISVYMPSGMDDLSGAAGAEKMAIATDVYRFITDSVADHEMFIVGGDFNETRCGRLDRVVAHKDGSVSVGKDNAKGLMEDFVGPLASTCVDLARHLNPEGRMYTFRRLGGDKRKGFYERNDKKPNRLPSGTKENDWA